MKIWEKGIATEAFIETFTVGNDRVWDLALAKHDILGNLAHIMMLERVGLLQADELKTLVGGLRDLAREAEAGKLHISPDHEDIHSEIEWLLTERLGEVGKKIHSGRSRNDQVLLDLRLYMREELYQMAVDVRALFDLLMAQSERYKDNLLVGYTHFQVAMPSSFGLWFGAYAESLTDDLLVLQSVFEMSNQNPLGSAAGYGSSFPLDRQLTTDLLGFARLNVNAVYAQMTRGKLEKNVTFALSNIAATLAKMAMDMCLYMSQNFDFVGFPDSLTTGSSLMPHKKNPDVWELIRAKCNQIQALPATITLMINNLPSGYHRDFQLLKEHLMPAFQSLHEVLQASRLMLSHIIIKDKDLRLDDRYRYIFSVDNVNALVMAGKSFREAYKEVAHDIAQGTFAPTALPHTHIGSLGNLRPDLISEKMENIMARFDWQSIETRLQALLG